MKDDLVSFERGEGLYHSESYDIFIYVYVKVICYIIWLYIVLTKTLRTDSNKQYIFKELRRKTNDNITIYFYRNILLSFHTKYQTQ